MLYWQVAANGEDARVGFARPWALWLSGIGFLLLLLGLLDTPAPPRFWFSRVSELSEIPQGWVARYSRLPVVLRSVALVLIALALARPQRVLQTEFYQEGIDLMFVLDLSQSMEEQDLEKNRLDAGQRTIREFLRKRSGKGDRIGLVVFAKEAMLQCPLTLDYKSLDSIVAGLQIGDVPAMGTAIGDALGLALASLQRGGGSSKVVILLSDGDWNNARYMDPAEARALSLSLGVRVFTVLLGQEVAARGSQVPSGQNQYAVNPSVLKELAASTGGLYFNAKDNWELNHSFEEIRANLAKTESALPGEGPGQPLYRYFLWLAMMLLGLERLLAATRFRSFP